MTDAQIEQFMPQVSVMMTEMSALPEGTKTKMAAIRADPGAQAQEVVDNQARFSAADANQDGMLSHAEWIVYHDSLYASRCARYPDGWLPKPTDEVINAWYAAMVTLSDNEEVSLEVLTLSTKIINACMVKIMSA